MNDQEKIRIQGETIERLQEENMELKQKVEELTYHLKTVVMPKDEVEIKLYDDYQKLQAMLEEYSGLIVEMREKKKEYEEANKQYIEATNEAIDELKLLAFEIQNDSEE